MQKPTIKKVFSAICSLVLILSMIFPASIPSLAFYNEPESIKGVASEQVNLVDNVVELGAKQVIFNFTMSRFYSANANDMKALDDYLKKLSDKDITVTAVILNDFQNKKPELLPVAFNQAGVAYYQFNSTTSAGQIAIAEVANQLSVRYKDKISNWIIGNEINDRSKWNYIGITDVREYSQAYASAFKIFYDRIKAQNPQARVFVPFEMRWNCIDDVGTNGKYKAQEMLPMINELLSGTDYGIAWHPYPEERNQLNFSTQNPNAKNDPYTPLINFKNLNILTDYMQRSEMLSPDKKVRHLLLSEFGLSSDYGEALQAQALTEAFNLAKANPYVEGFFVNKLVDAPEEGTAYGLMKSNQSTKKQAYQIYKGLQASVQKDRTPQGQDSSNTVDSKHPDLVTVFRVYNPNSGEHLYTTNQTEYKHLSQIGWQGENIAWYGSVDGSLVYRLYNRHSGEHFYTMNRLEADQLVKSGWKDEGVAWRSDFSNRRPIYRLYNPNAKGVAEAGAHHYTADAHERDILSTQGWRYEGIGWYGVYTGQE
ncbi:hypothetical protein FACS189418_1730 [Clostridia bacterium]|nr:hypothetical protein FACS189418_1730 [Clostridia bacterium]